VSRPRVIILHPKDWAKKKYPTGYDYVHVSIGGKIPRKRNKVPTYDGYADMVTDEGKQNLFDAFKKIKPDIFLFWLHGGFGQQILAKLKEISPGTRVCFWFGNHRPNVAGNVTQVRRWVDMLFLNSTDERQFKMYRRIGLRVGTLWDGFDPQSVKLAEKKPKYDCVFGGNTYLPLVQSHRKGHKLDFPGGKIRYDFISKVAKHFKMLVRSGYKTWPKHVQVLPEIFHPHYTDFLRDGKITLDVNHFPTLRQAYTRRMIRSLFARRCHVRLYTPGIEEHFENHKHLVWFKNIEEGIDLVRYYVEHDNEREEIAEAGYKLACEKWTFRERAADFERQTRPMIDGAGKKAKKAARLAAAKKAKKKKGKK